MPHKLLPYLIALLLLASTVSGTTKPVDDNQIIPGERVGILTKNTTEKELQRQLPAHSIRRILYDEGEGPIVCATEIFPDSNKSAVIVWRDNRGVYTDDKNGRTANEKCNAAPAFSKPDYVVIWRDAWRTQNGARIGMNLRELEKANRKAITFLSCECCGDGGVVDWGSGTLSGSIYSDLDGSVSPTLGMQLNYFEVKSSVSEYRKNGNVVSTDLSIGIKKKIKISQITVNFKRGKFADS